MTLGNYIDENLIDENTIDENTIECIPEKAFKFITSSKV